MKYIVAIIRPEKLGVIREALRGSEIFLMTVSNVRGCGMQQGRAIEVFQAHTRKAELLPKIKLEIAVNDAFVEPTINTLVLHGRTGDGEIGDGKIFILPLEQCVRIRTGETGSIAIGPREDDW